MNILSKCCGATIERRGSCQCQTCTKCGNKIGQTTESKRVFVSARNQAAAAVGPANTVGPKFGVQFRPLHLGISGPQTY